MRRIFIFLILLVSTNFLYGQDIIATTSVISSVIDDISGKQIKVSTLVPAGSCPGHFDLKIGHLVTIEKKGILFAQGYEEYLTKIKDSIKNPKFTIYIVDVDGNWLIPANQITVYKKVADILSKLYPQKKHLYTKNITRAVKRIKITDKSAKEMIINKKMYGLPVICNSHLKDFLEYLGFKVVATYGRKEEFTPEIIRNLLTEAKNNNVKLIIDNIQAGQDTGKVLTKHLNIPHSYISNYPGVFPNTQTLRQTLCENIKKIVTDYETFNTVK